MEIIFLGTSSGTPTKTRNVSGVAIRKINSRKWCLVDCGEGTQHQILHTRLALNNLEVILITHVHGDHCFGLPGLLASAALGGRKKLLTIVGPSGIKEFVDAAICTSQLNLTFEIKFIEPKALNDHTDEFRFIIGAVELSHRVPSYGYVFTEKKVERKLDVQKLKTDGIEPGPGWSELQKGRDLLLPGGNVISAENYLLPPREPQTVVISGDNDTPGCLSSVSKTIDVLVHEATYTEEIAVKVGEGPQHCSAKKVAEYAESAKIKNLVLTHFSSRYQDYDDAADSISDIEKEAREYYKGNLFLAKDFDIYQLGTDGDLSKNS